MFGAKRQMAFASHIGGRAEQQDGVACFASRDGKRALLVVADGMGGHQGGALASRTVIEVAEGLWNGGLFAPENPRAFLETLCLRADDEIRVRGAAKGLSPHSTVAALLVTRDRAYWAHVGDSRVYGFCGTRLIFRTEDHSAVRKLVLAGKISESEAETHPEQHLLLRGLGGDMPTRPTFGQVQMAGNMGFVLCTDGFWATIRTDEMAALLTADDLSSACEYWVALAAERAGADSDNVTVAALRAPGSSLHRMLWPLYVAGAVALFLLLLSLFR